MVLTRKQLENYRTENTSLGEEDRINLVETIDALLDENHRLRSRVDDMYRNERDRNVDEIRHVTPREEYVASLNWAFDQIEAASRGRVR
ncbi:MAG: hypothetical protein WAN65_12740 [Candidatus Sulfotelmatobacter sp.]